MEITNEHEADIFDKYLQEFQLRNDASPVKHFALSDVFRSLKSHSEFGRIFSFMHEIQIQVALLNIDLCKIGNINKKIKENNKSIPINLFCDRMIILKSNSDYILRYRAIWDKIMAVIILMYKPEKFQSYSNAKSRKKSFLKIMREDNNVPDSFLSSIEQTIDDFDSMYRTTEAHSSGSAKKWSFEEIESPFSHQANMYWAWNAINEIALKFGNLFTHMAKNEK